MSTRRRADWAVGAYEAVRVVLSYRLGDRESAESLLETACERGLAWSCEPSFFGSWRWTPNESTHSLLDISTNDLTFSMKLKTLLNR